MINENRFREYNHTFISIQKNLEENQNKFTPQVVGNKVRLSVGIDEGKYSISIDSENRKFELSSTELIRIRKVELSSKKMALLFTLNNNELLSIFIAFAIDLESVILTDKSVSIVEIYNRYLYWQKMFKAEKQQLSESKVKGLIGELYILENYMFPKYGSDEAVRGWVGSESNHKDFAYADGMWYEAKAIDLGKVTVNIASIEQLQADTKGILIVSQLEKTSPENSHGIRVFDQLNRIKSKIEIDDVELSFLNKINSLGISLDIFSDPNHEANRQRYVIHNVESYLVDDKFPCLSREDIPTAIASVSYELILAEIEKNLTDFE